MMRNKRKMEQAKGSRSGHYTRLQGVRPTIGLLTEDIPGVGEGYLADILAGVTATAHERDANLFCIAGGALYGSPYDEFDGQRNILYEIATTNNMDGLMITGSIGNYVTPQELANLHNRYHPLPTVSIGAPLAGIPSVIVDNDKGLRDVLVHLIDTHRCRRIAFIRGPEGVPDAKRRYRIYAEVLAEYGLPLDPDLVAPGDFRILSGTAAIRLLLDRRQMNFEALVAANDNMALGALEALQARGIHVPGDIAVVGFDDIEAAKTALPSLTTVRQPMLELGRQAIEMLLAQMTGEEVPELVTLPAELVMRQSCGCLDPVVAQVAVRPVTEVGETMEEALVVRRDDILTDLVQAVRPFADIAPEWAGQLLDGFSADLRGESSDVFLSVLDRVLRQVIEEGSEVTAWQGVVSTLRRHALPYSSDSGVLARAETLWHQARVFIGEMAHKAQAQRRSRSEQQSELLRTVGQMLVTTVEVDGLMDVIEEELPRLGIECCYLSLYEANEMKGRLPEWSRLMLAYDTAHPQDALHPRERIELEAGGQRFPTCQMVPEGLLPHRRRYTMVVEPLCFREDQLGFAILEMGPRDGTVYEVLREELSSALKVALLLQERKQAEEALEKAYTEVEKRVEERTAELQREITEHMRAETEILHLQHLLQNVTDSMPSTLITLDTDGQVLTWNPTAEALTGQTAAQVRGHSLWQACPELARYRDLVERVLREGQVTRQYREQVLTEAGTVYRDVSVFPLEANDIEGVVLHIDDATRRVQLEEIMLQSAKMASVGGLAAGVAHEINNPLGAMLQSTQLLQMTLDLQRSRTRKHLEACGVDLGGLERYLQECGLVEYLDGIRATGARAAKIVADLLSFSRKSSSKLAPYNLNELVEQTLKLAETDYDLKRKYDFRNIEVVCELDPDLPEIVCDRQQIQQVVLNLVQNAAHALAKKQTVEGEGFVPRLAVRTEKQGEMVRLEVEDNGPGIPEEMRRRLFEPFFTTKDVGEGTGLGLWLCWSIVAERHQGRIWAEPVAKGGTRFVIELPVA